jgi:hypothetical protein
MWEACGRIFYLELFVPLFILEVYKAVFICVAARDSSAVSHATAARWRPDAPGGGWVVVGSWLLVIMDLGGDVVTIFGSW